MSWRHLLPSSVLNRVPFGRARRVLAVAAAALFLAGPATACADTHHSSVLVQCRGVEWQLPRQWHARIHIGYGGYFTISAGTFPLPNEIDAVAERAARMMKREDILILLIGYGSSEAASPPFARRPAWPVTIGPAALQGQFEHLPAHHRIARELFYSAGQAFDLQDQFAQPQVPRRQFALANDALVPMRVTRQTRTSSEQPARSQMLKRRCLTTS